MSRATIRSGSKQAYERALKLAQTDLDSNMEEVLALLREAVSDGYGPAEYALATWYDFGVGVRKNQVKGAALLEKAAAKGIADAAFNLAMSLELGLGVPKHKARACHRRQNNQRVAANTHRGAKRRRRAIARAEHDKRFDAASAASAHPPGWYM